MLRLSYSTPSLLRVWNDPLIRFHLQGSASTFQQRYDHLFQICESDLSARNSIDLDVEIRASQ